MRPYGMTRRDIKWQRCGCPCCWTTWETHEKRRRKAARREGKLFVSKERLDNRNDRTDASAAEDKY